jgi:hypothetical protein
MGLPIIARAKQLNQIMLDPVAAWMIPDFQDHPHRVTIHANDSNQITDFHLIISKSRARYLRSGIEGLPTSLTT